MVICTHKTSGRVVHEEGEQLPYVMKKLGFACTKEGDILGRVDDNDDDNDDADAKASADADNQNDK